MMLHTFQRTISCEKQRLCGYHFIYTCRFTNGISRVCILVKLFLVLGKWSILKICSVGFKLIDPATVPFWVSATPSKVHGSITLELKLNHSGEKSERAASGKGCWKYGTLSIGNCFECFLLGWLLRNGEQGGEDKMVMPFSRDLIPRRNKLKCYVPSVLCLQLLCNVVKRKNAHSSV